MKKLTEAWHIAVLLVIAGGTLVLMAIIVVSVSGLDTGIIEVATGKEGTTQVLIVAVIIGLIFWFSTKRTK